MEYSTNINRGLDAGCGSSDGHLAAQPLTWGPYMLCMLSKAGRLAAFAAVVSAHAGLQFPRASFSGIEHVAGPLKGRP